jgi:energy-coupling factor transporter transmembrane protein EcfT
VCLSLLNVYCDKVFFLPKEQYNALHPFTSFIPIFVFIVLRNIFTTARMYHIHLFEWLGKITLETYISQYHIWMATTGVNGSPKRLLQLVPFLDIAKYPLLTFFVASALCLFVSHRLFNCTLVLKSHFLPSSMGPEQAKRCTAVLAIWTAVVYAAGWTVHAVTSKSGLGGVADVASATTLQQ